MQERCMGTQKDKGEDIGGLGWGEEDVLYTCMNWQRILQNKKEW